MDDSTAHNDCSTQKFTKSLRYLFLQEDDSDVFVHPKIYNSELSDVQFGASANLSDE
jgi:hypothetical protein